MSCDQGIVSDGFCPPQEYKPKVKLGITCPTDHPHLVNIPRLKGTMAAIGVSERCRAAGFNWKVVS